MSQHKNNKKPKTVLVEQLECGRCKYTWYPRISRSGKTVIPKSCANKDCKSIYWNKERVRNIKKK